MKNRIRLPGRIALGFVFVSAAIIVCVVAEAKTQPPAPEPRNIPARTIPVPGTVSRESVFGIHPMQRRAPVDPIVRPALCKAKHVTSYRRSEMRASSIGCPHFDRYTLPCTDSSARRKK